MYARCKVPAGALTLFSFSVAAVLPDGLGKTTTLTGRVGQSITLHTGVSGLPGNSQIAWSRGSEQYTILYFDEGKLEVLTSLRFRLDRDSGSLTINSLNKNDTQLYRVHINNGNGSTHDFNLTVVGRYWHPRSSSHNDGRPRLA